MQPWEISGRVWLAAKERAWHAAHAINCAVASALMLALLCFISDHLLVAYLALVGLIAFQLMMHAHLRRHREYSFTLERAEAARDRYFAARWAAQAEYDPDKLMNELRGMLTAKPGSA